MTRSSFFKNKTEINPNAERVIVEEGSKFTAKVFLYMLIALAITGLTCGLCGFLINLAISTGISTTMDIFSSFLIISLIAYLPIIIWIQVSVLKGGKGLKPAFAVYSVIMGVLISSFTAFLPFNLIAIAFGLTCAAFAVMALIAWTSKKNLSYLAIVGFGILSGVCLISLFSLILYLFFPGVNVLLSAIVSGGIFLFIILVTLADLYNIRQIASRGYGNNNLALTCAFSLYVDFIYIFIRLLSLIVRIYAIFRSNN